jgi:hypothetical protein
LLSLVLLVVVKSLAIALMPVSLASFFVVRPTHHNADDIAQQGDS